MVAINGRYKQKISMPDHVVYLFSNNHMVGQFSFAATDSRFVKSLDLFKLAFAQIVDRQSQNTGFEIPNNPCKRMWDHFEISYYGMIMRGNRKGEMIVDKRLD
jgi:hypothetical protein